MDNLFKPKFFSILKSGITGGQLSDDVLAGIVVGIVALPLSIAFAAASGVSPEKGLITAVIAGFLISFLGGSRVQIGGPTGAFVIIIAGIVEQYGLDGLMISTILAGFILVIFGLLRLGNLLKFFPHPLIVGFTSGIAVVIFSTQIRDALGLPIDSVPSDFIEKWSLYISYFGSISIPAAAITVLTILISVMTKRLTSRIPGSFISIILLTAAVQIFNIDVATIETFYGSIPRGFEFSLPSVSLASLPDYFSPALTIAILGAIESLLSAVVADGMIGGKHRSNTELIAQGLANIITPFFGGIPATGAIARTATNIRNGGRTPVAGMVHAITLLLIMLFFGQWARLIPMSTLAGILIVVAYNMSEWRSFSVILKGSVFDIIILLSTFFVTVLFDLTLAIQIGVVLSALLFMKRMADISENQLEETVDSDVIENYGDLPEGVSIYEISGPLFFASARRYSETIQEIGLKCRVLIIRMRHVSFIDQTGLHNLNDALHILRKKNIIVLLSGVNSSVHTDFKKYGIYDLVPEDQVFEKFNDATQRALELI